MTEFTRNGTIDVLSAIKAFHGPQDVGEVAITLWTTALNYGGVDRVADAVEAVVRHYSTRGSNPWITPGDVIGRVREIRSERLAGITPADLTRDIDESDHAGYLATAKARAAAIEDGMPLEVALVDVRPVAALERGR